MILIDCKGDKPQSKPPVTPGADIINHIKRLGIPCQRADLDYGDATFEGNGPLGSVAVGIERKALHDMLTCIDDSRYTGHQRIGMELMYGVSVLMVEGHWKPHDGNGLLMEGFSGGTAWGYNRHRGRQALYAKLYRYLISVSLSGVVCSYSRDVWHTAYNIVEWYHYFQKPWREHKALMAMQKVQVPTLQGKPTLTRRWAFAIDDIGETTSEAATKVFKTPYDLASADEEEWLRVPGVGVKTAQRIVREVRGW